MKKIILLLIMIASSIGYIDAQNKKLRITIGSTVFTATLNDSEAAQAFLEMLPLTVNMSEMGGYEKYHWLPESLPGSASNPGTTYEGDLMIYSSSCLVLFYTTRSTSYNYIRLGRIDNTSGLRQALGTGNVQVQFDPEDQSTAIEDIETEGNLYQVTRAQASGYLQVSGHVRQLSLLSVTGAIQAQSAGNTVDISQLKPGVYLLRIHTEKEGIITKKIIKKQ